MEVRDPAQAREYLMQYQHQLNNGDHATMMSI